MIASYSTKSKHLFYILPPLLGCIKVAGGNMGLSNRVIGNDIIMKDTVFGRQRWFPRGTPFTSVVRSIKNRRYPFNIYIMAGNNVAYVVEVLVKERGNVSGVLRDGSCVNAEFNNLDELTDILYNYVIIRTAENKNN